jgi:hypothetical protein
MPDTPPADADPSIGREIALGALIRLNTSQDYLDALLPRLDTALAGNSR